MLSRQDIKLKNFADLVFARRILEDSPSAGLYMLGMDDAAAQKLQALSPAELEQLSDCDIILFGWRMSADTLTERLRDFAQGNPLALTHMMLQAIGRREMTAVVAGG
jgi:hypothetical protein